jgi:hypothetical protein
VQLLTNILLLDDLEEKAKTDLLELRNLGLYKKDIRKFANFLNNRFFLPIVSVEYSDKIMYVDFILRKTRLYLSLNIIYDNDNKIVCVEAVTQQLTLKKIYDVDNIRTLSGRRFKQNIVINKNKNVNVVDISALVPCSENIKVIENGIENFACRDKIIKKFEKFFDVQTQEEET